MIQIMFWLRQLVVKIYQEKYIGTESMNQADKSFVKIMKRSVFHEVIYPIRRFSTLSCYFCPLVKYCIL